MIDQQPFAPWMSASARTVRRGHFWIQGERLEQSGLTYQRGAMYVEWEAPETMTKPYPVVLMHGGGFQGTEWFDTPDGRPGWAQRLVEAGYAVLVVDRPGHGRSPFHVQKFGEMGPPFFLRGRAAYLFSWTGCAPTHSASGPDGWLIADRRSTLVKAIVAIEPMGPPFADIPNLGAMGWGVTAAPLRFEPAIADA